MSFELVFRDPTINWLLFDYRARYFRHSWLLNAYPALVLSRPINIPCITKLNRRGLRGHPCFTPIFWGCRWNNLLMFYVEDLGEKEVASW